MSPMETLREAARVMRERAHAAFQPWHPWSDEELPTRSTIAEWQEDINGYLGGEWGEHAASWHPAVALAVATWLDAEAVVMGEMEPFVDLINAAVEHKSGVKTYLSLGRKEDGSIAMHADTSQAALAVAHAFLRTDARGPYGTSTTEEA